MLARTPAEQTAAACTVQDKPRRGLEDWIDAHIEGPTREAVESAVADYCQRHAACEPFPAFYPIQNHEPGIFVVSGGRGKDPRK